MDLDSYRNTGIMFSVIGAGCIIGSISCFANYSPGGGVALIFMALFLQLPWIGYFLQKKKLQNAQVKEVRMRTMLQQAAGRLQAETRKINNNYNLGLCEADILAIIAADEPLQALRAKVTPGKPSVADFCLSMETTLNRLMEEMCLSEDDMGNIYLEFLSMITAVNDELIDEIVQSFASTLPPQMHFLKDKVNYELACLGHIMQHGINQNRQDICQKVNSIRKKRGYID